MSTSHTERKPIIEAHWDRLDRNLYPSCSGHAHSIYCGCEYCARLYGDVRYEPLTDEDVSK